MNAENLKNAMVFMERAPMTGKEALAWVQTYQALVLALKALEVPQAPVAE